MGWKRWWLLFLLDTAGALALMGSALHIGYQKGAEGEQELRKTLHAKKLQIDVLRRQLVDALSETE